MKTHKTQRVSNLEVRVNMYSDNLNIKDYFALKASLPVDEYKANMMETALWVVAAEMKVQQEMIRKMGLNVSSREK